MSKATPFDKIDLSTLTLGNKEDKSYDNKDDKGNVLSKGSYYSASYRLPGSSEFTWQFPPIPFSRLFENVDPKNGKVNWSILVIYPKEHDNAQRVKTFLEQLNAKTVELLKPMANAMHIELYGGQHLALKELIGYAKDKTTGNPKIDSDPGTFFKLYPSCQFYSPKRQKLNRKMLTQAKGEISLIMHARNIYSGGNGKGYMQIFVKSAVVTKIEMVGPEEPTELIEALNAADSDLGTNFDKMLANFKSQLNESPENDSTTNGGFSAPPIEAAQMTSISGDPSASLEQFMTQPPGGPMSITTANTSPSSTASTTETSFAAPGSIPQLNALPNVSSVPHGGLNLPSGSIPSYN